MERLDIVGQSAFLLIAVASVKVKSGRAARLVSVDQTVGLLMVEYLPTGQIFEITIKEK